MSKKLKYSGLFFVSIAILMLLAHSMIPHHHHGAESFISCCASSDENPQPINCTFHAEEHHTDNHHCFQCSVEREWPLSSTNQYSTAALLFNDHLTFNIKSEPAYHYHNTSSFNIPYFSGIPYRGPPSLG